MHRVRGGDAHTASRILLFLREGPPLWTLVHHLFTEYKAAATANGFTSVIVMNKVFVAALRAFVRGPLLCFFLFHELHSSME